MWSLFQNNTSTPRYLDLCKLCSQANNVCAVCCVWINKSKRHYNEINELYYSVYNFLEALVCYMLPEHLYTVTQVKVSFCHRQAVGNQIWMRQAPDKKIQNPKSGIQDSNFFKLSVCANWEWILRKTN